MTPKEKLYRERLKAWEDELLTDKHGMYGYAERAIKLLKEDIERMWPDYEIKCPKCGSKDMHFDAHAGFAYCKNCHFDTQETGPDICRVQKEKDNEENR